MKKLTLPNNPHKGLKIYCKTCRVDNAKCKHYDQQVYRIRLYIPGNSDSVRTKMLEATNYKDAVIESVDFEKELKANGFEKTKIIESDTSIDYNIVDAIVKYREYMSGESKFAHLKKNLSQGHIDECVRYCYLFAESVAVKKNIRRTRPYDIDITDVSNFYILIEENMLPKL